MENEIDQGKKLTIQLFCDKVGIHYPRTNVEMKLIEERMKSIGLL